MQVTTLFQISAATSVGSCVKLTIVVKLKDGRTVAPTRTTCIAELSQKPLVSRVGRGVCRVKVPRSATGKSLVLSAPAGAIAPRT